MRGAEQHNPLKQATTSPREKMSNSDNRITTSDALLSLASEAGDDMQKCWDQFFPRIQNLTLKTLRYLPHRREDAFDAAQNAFLSFWKVTERTDVLQTLDRNSLWKLLATIAVRKAREVARREFAEKRGGGRVTPFSALTESSSKSLQQLLAEVSTTDFDLAAEERLLSLPEELRQIATLRLYNHTNAEIAGLLNCSERRVDRKIRLIKSQWDLDIQAGNAS